MVLVPCRPGRSIFSREPGNFEVEKYVKQCERRLNYWKPRQSSKVHWCSNWQGGAGEEIVGGFASAENFEKDWLVKLRQCENFIPMKRCFLFPWHSWNTTWQLCLTTKDTPNALSYFVFCYPRYLLQKSWLTVLGPLRATFIYFIFAFCQVSNDS